MLNHEHFNLLTDDELLRNMLKSFTGLVGFIRLLPTIFSFAPMKLFWSLGIKGLETVP